MAELEMVINGLECHKRAMYGEIDEHGIACNSCPYKDMESTCHSRTEGRLIADALALLKAQEPRVLTHEEVINLPEGAVAWFEEMDNGSRRYIQPMMSNGKAFMIGTHVDINVSPGTFNWTNMRFWTSRPTYELMEATPWD